MQLTTELNFRSQSLVYLRTANAYELTVVTVLSQTIMGIWVKQNHNKCLDYIKSQFESQKHGSGKFYICVKERGARLNRVCPLYYLSGLLVLLLLPMSNRLHSLSVVGDEGILPDRHIAVYLIPLEYLSVHPKHSQNNCILSASMRIKYCNFQHGNSFYTMKLNQKAVWRPEF